LKGNGHTWVDPIFDFSVDKVPETPGSGFSIDVDDCDCAACDEARGPIALYSTLSLRIHTGKEIFEQRLTPHEAIHIAKVMTMYANIIIGLNEAFPEELEELA